MKTHRLKGALVCLFLFSIVLPVAAKDKWLNLRSKNFNVISNADEGETRKLVLKLEQFRFVFSQLLKSADTSPLPITVVVFKNDDSYKPFKPLYNGKPANISGYFLRSTDENLITLDISSRREERPLAVIFHEYTHYLTSNTLREWPIWLKEGIAELYSSFDVNKNQVTLGAPISSHVFLLREKKFVPLQTLFTVARNSPVYNEREKQGIFYAQSWALAHYLMFGDKMARQPQLVQYIRLLYSGLNPDEAFIKAFNTDLATMEKNLREYVGKDSYDVRIYTLQTVEGEKEITVTPLSDAEAQYYQGKILLKTNRIDESEAYFKKALELDANLTGAYEGLGFVAMRRKQFTEAKAHFKEATVRDSKNFLAHFYYAETLEREASEKAEPLTAEVTKIMTEELKTAIRLMPSFAPSYSLLGFVCQSPFGDLREGLQAMQRAVQLEPQNQMFKVNLANIQMRMKDYAAARKTLQPLLNASDNDESGMKASAQAMLKSIEYNEKYEASRIERTTNAGSNRELPATEPKVPATGETPQPTAPGRPFPDLSKAEEANGTITAVECKGTAMTITLKMADKTLKFFISNHNEVPFFSHAAQFSVDIVCGPNQIPATIYFNARKDNSLVAGDAVAVEFVK
jgi:tetratricopeptide (TPR) repeat protein